METAPRSLAPGHLGYLSDQVGRPLHWNAEQEMIGGVPAANRLLYAVDYRSPWRLPGPA